MGGLATHIAKLEQSLGQTLHRLGAPTIAARIQLRSNDWIQVRDDRPRLTRSAEVEVTRGLDFGIKCAGLRKLPYSRKQGARSRKRRLLLIRLLGQSLPLWRSQ